MLTNGEGSDTMYENKLKELHAAEPPDDTLKTAADAVDETLLAAAQTMAEAGKLPVNACYTRLVNELLRRVRERTPAEVTDADSRTAKWRVRVRLYRADKPDEPEADSDDDLTPDVAGNVVLAGLPAVAEHLAALASGYHQAPCAGLDLDTLKHRLKSLRPTLSRRGGSARWRVPYMTRDGEWLAVVDVQREAKAHESAA